MGDGFVRIPKRYAALDQVIGQIGGRCKALQRGGAHGVLLDPDSTDQIDEDRECVAHRVCGIEQALLVLLIILVVGQRLAFHQREQGHEVTVHATGLAAGELRHIGVLFLGHD